MATVNIHEAKTHLSRLIEQAERGEEVIIARSGRPVARLVGLDKDQVCRVPGAWKDLIKIAGDFDELPESIAASFCGEDE